MSLDPLTLRERLREYDPSLPRCPERVKEHRNYAPDYTPEDERALWNMPLYTPCCRPAGHEGPCRNTRLVLGFPGYDTLLGLVDEVLELRAEVAESEERRLQLLDDAGGLENLVDAATAREAGITFDAVSDIANDYIRGNGTFSFLVERLRELALNSAEKIASQRHDDHVMDVQHAHEEGIAEGERRERAAVVACLRAEALEWDESGPARLALRLMSDAIERGDHRTPEKT